jgi:histone H3/H4
VVTAAIPSLKGAMPGLQGISTLLVNSFANGAANAFLTLRVGLIARDYCAALTYPDKTRIRRGATVAALSMVAEIAREQGARVAQAAWGAVTDVAKSTAAATARETTNAVRAAGSATVRGFKAAGGLLSKKDPPAQ